MKRNPARWLLCAVLALVLAVSLPAAPVRADLISGDWGFVYTDDGGVTLTHYYGSSVADVRIPSELSGSPVTGIGDEMFFYSNITGVTIPDSVKRIGRQAFDSCGSLTTVTLGSGVTSIGDWAFSGCSSLTTVTIPDSVKSLGECAFYGCFGLKRAYISDLAAWCGINVGEYGSPLCNNDCRLYLNGAEVAGPLTIPDGVTGVAPYAFQGCAGLTSVSLPDSVKSIGKYAFYGCSALQSAKLGGVTSIGDHAFSQCGSLTAIAIPGSVTSLGECAFSGCSGLAGAAIPEGIADVPEGAFAFCTGMTDVVLPTSLKSVQIGAFYECTSLASIHYPGTAADWAKVTIEDSNGALESAALCGVLSVRYASKTIKTGEVFTFTPKNNVGDCTWRVGNGAVAQVDDSGRVIGVSAGNTWLYCRDSVGAEAKCLLKIVSPLSIRYAAKTIILGTPFTFEAVGSSGTCTWRTGNTAVATVDSTGKVTGKSVGNTWLYCKDSSGAEVKCYLEVREPLSIRYSKKTVIIGQPFQFTATGGAGGYTWRVGNSSVAAVDAAGKVTGKAEGNTYLYCKDSSGTEVKCYLEIRKPLSIRYSEKTVKVGASFQFTATGGTGGYTWRVGNTAIAAVDSTGKVTGKAVGNTWLYCTDSAGSEVKCLLKIK